MQLVGPLHPVPPVAFPSPNLLPLTRAGLSPEDLGLYLEARKNYKEAKASALV